MSEHRMLHQFWRRFSGLVISHCGIDTGRVVLVDASVPLSERSVLPIRIACAE
jgi:hypothetical protein